MNCKSQLPGGKMADNKKLFGPKLKYIGAGKGCRYRPVNKKKYDENYERIFRKKDK